MYKVKLLTWYIIKQIVNHWTEIWVEMMISDLGNILKKYLYQSKNVEGTIFILELGDSGIVSRDTLLLTIFENGSLAMEAILSL